MVPREQIQALADQIADAFQPEQIILFGSYAYGTPGLHSDVDLLVVMPYKGHAAYQAAAIRAMVRTTFPLDVIVRNSQELMERVALGDWFLREVTERGQVLYAADHC